MDNLEKYSVDLLYWKKEILEKELEKLNQEIERVSQINRRTGQSTRLMNEYIETLFKEGSVKIKDHFDLRASHERLFQRVVKRLENEQSKYYYKNGVNVPRFIFDLKNLTITLNK